jgi:hypothetical protein
VSDILKAAAWSALVNASDAHSADRTKSNAQGLSDAAKAWARASGEPAPVAVPSSGGLTFPNYGRSKGQPVAGASREDLQFYLRGCERTLADESKSRWHDKERALAAAIEAELAK